MAGFANIKELVDAELNGKVRFATFRKVPNQATAGLGWFDLSMSPGNPVPQYYAATPLSAVQLKRSTDGGLDHGAANNLGTKYLRKLTVMSINNGPLPMPFLLCDYLLFYPFIDEGTTDVQVMSNGVALPRYTDGAGVQIMAVSVAARTGGQSFSVNYTNQDGVAGRVTPNVTQNTFSVTGTIVTSAPATNGGSMAFIPLQAGDTGVRSIESVTMNGTDVGLFCLVLVKPLAEINLRGNDAPAEVDFLLDFGQCPEIKDDAYLNFLCLPRATLVGNTLNGIIKTIWT